jgi:hypothetical protein
LALGFLLFYPLSHDKLSSSLTSGPFASKEPWFTPIEEIFMDSDVGDKIFSWVFTNPAILSFSNIALLVLTSYYWQRVTLFKEYVDEKQKEVEYTISDLEFKYIKCKDMLVRSRL